MKVTWHVEQDKTGRAVIWWVHEAHTPHRIRRHGRPMGCTEATLCITLAALMLDLAALDAALWAEQAEGLVGR